MVEPAPVSTLLPPLPAARPPTPPRESHHSESKSVSLVGRFFQQESSSRRSSTNSNFTPESSAESPNQTAGGSKKKVGFADWTEYNEPPEVSFDGKGQIKHAVQRLPPSSERKPSKSILKPFNGSHEEDYSGLGGGTKLLPPHLHATFATMLESIVKQLAGKDRSSKQDAYLMLSGSLKASDNVPDMKALKEKMPLFCQFIWRDLSEKLDDGKPDSTLVTKALVLLSSFLQKPAVAETFPSEFPLQIVDHTIKALEDGSSSKDILKHLMFVLAHQNFPAKVMNQERTGRLIAALHEIENHVKGKSIVMGRLDVYRTLLRQSKPHMLSNTIWVHDLFTDMLSSLREIRTPAITFGLESSFVLGRESPASRAVSNLFKAEYTGEKEGLRFGDFYAGRLKDLIKNKESSSTVPQIFSVIMLFLRAKPQILEQWAFLKLFLGVLRDCFNTSDSATKMEANYAWNRLVYAVLPNEKTPPNMKAVLVNILIAQLKKRSNRKATLSSVCNLLYYALKPTSGPTQLDMYWDEYVVSIVGQCLVAGVRTDPDLVAKDAADACSILQGLFEPTMSRPWTETRAMENLQYNSVDPTDLPGLDSKWLRKSYSRVFPVLGPLLEKLFWDLGEDSDILRLWDAYITSIASPMVMEVKVSIDTMGCVASLFNLLHKIWNLGPKNIGSLRPCNEPSLPQSTSAFLRSFEKLVSQAVKGLGLLAFTEKLLCITDETFIVIATPSQHPKRPRGVIKPPLHHFLLLLTKLSPNLEYDLRFSQMVRSILLPFFEARKTRRSRLELVRDLHPLLPAEITTPCKLIWQVLADFATIATDTRDNKDVNRSNEQPLGVDYQDVMKVLEVGINMSPSQPLPGWNALFGALATSATLDAGDAGRAIAVVEPLAKSLVPKLGKASNTSIGLAYFHLLLGKATPYPKDRQSLDAAERRLWGARTAGPSLSFDPYAHLYDYVQVSLVAAYDSLSPQNHHDYADIISSVANLLDRCPSQLSLNVLTQIQNGISCWILDGIRKVTGGTPLSHSVIALWATVMKILAELPTLYSHTVVLRNLEQLICSGLESKHKSTVNKSINLWNSVFGNCEDGLEYPELVKEALLRLRAMADIQLPFFPHSFESEMLIDQRQPTDFTDSQDDSSVYSGASSLDSAFKMHFEPHLKPVIIRKIRQSTPQVIIEVGRTQSRKRSREATPDTSNRKSRKRAVTPRLRHDDSQVQFEAIESSPMADRVVDSQLLTEKQKEVKERQRADAAMFPDLRSSPPQKVKAAERSLEDPELPIRRSSSKIREKLSPNVLRQTTPTLVLPSDDDNQVPSSPTPTRSLRGETHAPDPPSSPPEAVLENNLDYVEHISSSPPEVSPEPENDTALMSVDPSAQMDPYAVEINDRTISTFESTPFERGSSPIDPSAQLHATEAEQQQRIAKLDETLIEGNTEAGLNAVVNPQLPETPLRNGTKSPSNQQTPLTPQFVDARSSPASSDKVSANGDIFEDAVSSPRLNGPKKRPKQSSPPLSDADESSMLRLVAEYDEGSGRVGQHSSFVENKENQECRVHASASKQTSLSAEISPRKLSLRKRLEQPSEDKGPGPSSENQKSSSDPSLIPETPAAKPNETLMKEGIDEEGIDEEDTIVVDCSTLERLDDRPTAKSRGWRRKLTTYAHKRKVVIEDANEVPDSQDGQPAMEKRRKRSLSVDTSKVADKQEAESALAKPSPKRRSPKKKAKPGRPPKKASQLSQKDPDVEAQQSRSPSVDLDASMQDMEIEVGSTDILPSSAKEETMGEAFDDTEGLCEDSDRILPTTEDVVTSDADIDVAATNYERFNIVQNMVKTMGQIADASGGTTIQATGPDIERVEETITNETIFKVQSSPTSNTSESENDTTAEVIAATTSDAIETSFEAPVEEKTSPTASEQVEREISAFQSMRGKLESLISDLRTVALSREEVHELEDLFFDAKKHLYSAEQRGRRGKSGMNI